MSRPSTPPASADGKIHSVFNSSFFGNQDQELDPDEIDRKSRKDKLSLMHKKNSPARSQLKNRWRDLLDSSFVLGENHGHIAAKRFLIENMKLFKDRGYNTIFFEHYGPENLESLAKCQESKGEIIPEDLTEISNYTVENSMIGLAYDFQGLSKTYCHKFDDLKQHYNFEQIIKKAAEVGIEIVPIEVSRENYQIHQRGENRMIYLNSNAVEKIDEKSTENPQLKYIVFIGASHVLSRYGTYGIAECLGLQDVVIYDHVVNFPAEENSKSSSADKVENTVLGVIRDKEISYGTEDEKIYEGFSMSLARHISEDLSFDLIVQNIDYLMANKKSEDNSSPKEDNRKNDLPFGTIRNPGRPTKKLKVSPKKGADTELETSL